MNILNQRAQSIAVRSPVPMSRLDLPVISKSTESAPGHFGWLAHFASQNIQASSKLTQELLSWKPEHTDLLSDLEGNYYFKN